MMDDTGAGFTGRLAFATGAVAIGSVASLATFFVAGDPFGTINDVGNAATGVLSACLAWRLRRQIAGRAGDVAVGAALLGATIAVAGSVLVISGTTGFFLAGLVSSVGFAGIGAWLGLASRGVGEAAGWPRGLRTLGIVAGSLMALGVAAAPGIPLRLDDIAAAPAWAYIGSVGWLGIYVAYPAWALWLGTTETRRAARFESLAGRPAPTRPTSEVS